jgi:hypothetical protein
MAAQAAFGKIGRIGKSFHRSMVIIFSPFPGLTNQKNLKTLSAIPESNDLISETQT